MSMEEFLSNFGDFRPNIQQFLDNHHLNHINLLRYLSNKPFEALHQDFRHQSLGDNESTFLAGAICELRTPAANNGNNGNVTLADVVAAIREIQGAIQEMREEHGALLRNQRALLEDISSRLPPNRRPS